MTKTLGFIMMIVVMLNSSAYIGFSQENMLIKICHSDGKVNGTVDVSVRIENNPGIATFSLRLNFDNTKLVPISINTGSVVLPDQITSNIQSMSDLSTLSFVSAFWVSPTDVVQDGTLYTVTFRVKQGAAEYADFGIDYRAGSIANSRLMAIPYESVKHTLHIDDLVSLTVEIKNMSLRAQNNTIQGDIDIKVTNHSSSVKYGDLFIAVYDSAHWLIWTTIIQNRPFAPGENSVRATGLSIENTNGSAYSVNIMCWDHVKPMRPLALPCNANLI